MPLPGPPNIEKLKRKRDAEGLLKALRHTDPAIRLQAANALDELGTEVTRTLAYVVLLHGNADMRQAATDRLRKLGAGAVGPLIDVVRMPFVPELFRSGGLQEEMILSRMAAVLAYAGTETVEAIIAQLHHEDVRARRWTAMILGELKDAQTVGPLTAALKDDDETVRDAACVALERIGGPDTERALADWHKQQLATPGNSYRLTVPQGRPSFPLLFRRCWVSADRVELTHPLIFGRSFLFDRVRRKVTICRCLLGVTLSRSEIPFSDVTVRLRSHRVKDIHYGSVESGYSTIPGGTLYFMEMAIGPGDALEVLCEYGSADRLTPIMAAIQRLGIKKAQTAR